MRDAKRESTPSWLLATIVGAAACASGAAESPPEPRRYPEIPTGGGPTLGAVNVVSVAFAGDTHTPDFKVFLESLARSGWLTRVAAEYGVRSVQYAAHVDLPTTAPAAVKDDEVQALLRSWLRDGTIPSAPTSEPTFLYVLFLPAGTSVATLSGDSCRANPGTGYHDMTAGPEVRVPYVVVPTCEPRFSAILSEVAAMELDVARLVTNALTDPSPRNEPAYALTDVSNPWTSLGWEVGDFCWGRLVEQSGYRLQRVWSNQAAASGGEPCIPAPADSIPFGMIASPGGLQKLVVGEPYAFTVTGWSRAPIADWTIQASPWVGDYPIRPELDRYTLNNGQSASLQVTIPYATPPGTYGAVLVQALHAVDSPAWPVAFVVR